MSDTSKQATERGSECNDGLGQPLAWLHTVRVLNGDPGELDEALSFATDNFPLGEAGLFESMSVLPLYGPATIDAAVAAERERLCAAIKAADDKASEGDYMLDSDDCISVIRGTWNPGA